MITDKKDLYSSSEWKKIRQDVLSKEPYDRLMLMRGVQQPATCVHHIIRWAEQWDDETRLMLFLDRDNLIPLSEEAHNWIHSRKHRNKIFDEVQLRYIEDMKLYLCQKYLNRGITIRYTDDYNKRARNVRKSVLF